MFSHMQYKNCICCFLFNFIVRYSSRCSRSISYRMIICYGSIVYSDFEVLACTDSSVTLCFFDRRGGDNAVVCEEYLVAHDDSLTLLILLKVLKLDNVFVGHYIFTSILTFLVNVTQQNYENCCKYYSSCNQANN